MKKRILLIAAITTIILILTACTPVETCHPAMLVAPVLNSPVNYAEITSLSPTLSWTFPTVHYPLPTSTGTCIPERYSISISTGPFYKDNHGGITPGNTTSFTPLSPLEPGKMYAWNVQPMSYEGSGPLPGYRYFFTGETCETAALIAPELLLPYNGAEVGTLEPSLIWSYPDGCIPEGYRIDLSIDPTFADTSLSGGTGNPGTRWGPGVPLENCTHYYWKVAPINGTTLGPASNVLTFRTNTGGCGPEPGVPGSTITGKIWEDLCAIPDGPLPTTAPPGCIFTSGGGLSGNGILDPGEPGILDVVVRLGSGPCPSTNEGVTFTDENGIFTFENIPGGTHCISVDVADNTSTLIPGGWTFPEPTGGLVQFARTVPDGDTEFNVNFGWMYQFGNGSYAQVMGGVWDDECSRTLQDYAGTLPANCLRDGHGIIKADGIKQESEVFINGVKVEAFLGSCGSSSPVVPIAQDLTDESGVFEFLLPAAGSGTDYCIVVDSANMTNAPLLEEGVWTYPETYYLDPPTFTNLTVSAGSPVKTAFGWDYLENFFMPAFDLPFLDIIKEVYCYIGPNYSYKAYRGLVPGQAYAILGLDPTRKWYLIDPDSLLVPGMATPTPVPGKFERCWVPETGGKPSGDLSGLGIFTGPTIKTPTPTPAPEVQDPCSQYLNKTSCETFGKQFRCVWQQINDTFGICYKP